MMLNKQPEMLACRLREPGHKARLWNWQGCADFGNQAGDACHRFTPT
jgi:hypothetical protein